MDNVADSLCFGVRSGRVAARPIHLAAIRMLPGHIRTEEVRVSSSKSAPHVIGPPTTEMTKLPPLD